MTDRESTLWETMLTQVPMEWWDEFRRLVDGDEVGPNFVEFFERSEDCQRAFELVLRKDPIMIALVDAINSIPDQEVDPDGRHLPPVSA